MTCTVICVNFQMKVSVGEKIKAWKMSFFFKTLSDGQEWAAAAHARARHGDMHSMHEEETKLGGRRSTACGERTTDLDFEI